VQTAESRLDPHALRRQRNFFIAYGSELARPLLRGIARAWATGRPTPPSTWRQVVILGASHIGDLLYRTASLRPLRHALPQAHITYLCSPAVAELLESNPDVDDVLPIAGEGLSSWSRTVWAALKARQFDAALCSNHIAYHADLALVTALGIPNRVAFAHKGFSGLSTLPVPVTYPQPAPAYFRAMIVAIDRTAPDGPLTPAVYPTPADRAAADAALHELGVDSTRPLVACTLTARQQETRLWPPSEFLQALAAVAREMPLQVVLCGSRGDGPFLREVAARAPFPCYVLAGRLTLRGLAAFFARCDAFLGTDSGPRHIANAAGIPVVFVRSLRVSRVEAGPYVESETDVAPDDEFLAPEEQTAALARIDPESVALAVSRALATRARPGVA
jgi:ADP-heptose:LPS heptosyltransferase